MVEGTFLATIYRLLRAGDGIRTHDLLLGKQLRYHCATPAYPSCFF